MRDRQIEATGIADFAPWQERHNLAFCEPFPGEVLALLTVAPWRRYDPPSDRARFFTVQAPRGRRGKYVARALGYIGDDSKKKD